MNFKGVKNLELSNPEVKILRTYKKIELDGDVEERLLTLANNDSVFNPRVLQVNKNKLNHWILSLLNTEYGDKGILFLSKILSKKKIG